MIVNDVVPVTGVPLRVLSDLGSEFIGDVTSNLFTALDIQHNTISKGNKGGNGIVENMNGQVRKRLTRLIRQFPRDWRWKTGIVLHDLRTSGMPSLANLSPAQLLLGMQPRTLWAAEWTADKVADLPSDTRAWYQDVAQTVQFLASKAHRLKGDNAANRRLDAIARGARDTEFRRGDRVLAATDASVKSKRLDAPKFSLATVIEPLDPKQSGDKSLVLVFDADPGNPRRIPVDFVKKLEPAMLERLDSLPNPKPFQRKLDASRPPAFPSFGRLGELMGQRKRPQPANRDGWRRERKQLLQREADRRHDDVEIEESEGECQLGSKM